MKSQTVIVPEGLGSEIDYDNYDRNPDRFFASADDWWINYCLLGGEELKQSNIKTELLNDLNNDEYLAMVVNHFVGENYKNWLDRGDIDSLGGLTPRQCLNSAYGIKRLRMLFLASH